MMLPHEPTNEMVTAGVKAVTGHVKRDAVAAIWRAMWQAGMLARRHPQSFHHWPFVPPHTDEADAQGTEARRAETGTGSVHDGPVRKDAPKL